MNYLPKSCRQEHGKEKSHCQQPLIAHQVQKKKLKTKGLLVYLLFGEIKGKVQEMRSSKTLSSFREWWEGRSWKH